MRGLLFRLAGSLTCLVLFVGLLMAGSASITAREQATAPAFELETPVDESAGFDDADAGLETDEALPFPDPGKTEQADARQIEPETFGLPESVTRVPLERIEPAVPLPEPAATTSTEPVLLPRPLALSAGLISFDGRLVQLAGLVPEPAERTCGETGRSWPCGMMARTALRNWLRARSMLCSVPEAGWEGTVTARCTVGGQDPAAWLVQQGWAEPEAGSDLAQAAEAARSARLGRFGDDPRLGSAIIRVDPAVDPLFGDPADLQDGLQAPTSDLPDSANSQQDDADAATRRAP